jgi:hypothetical protein
LIGLIRFDSAAQLGLIQLPLGLAQLFTYLFSFADGFSTACGMAQKLSPAFSAPDTEVVSAVVGHFPPYFATFSPPDVEAQVVSSMVGFAVEEDVDDELEDDDVLLFEVDEEDEDAVFPVFSTLFPVFSTLFAAGSTLTSIFGLSETEGAAAAPLRLPNGAGLPLWLRPPGPPNTKPRTTSSTGTAAGLGAFRALGARAGTGAGTAGAGGRDLAGSADGIEYGIEYGTEDGIEDGTADASIRLTDGTSEVELVLALPAPGEILLAFPAETLVVFGAETLFFASNFCATAFAFAANFCLELLPDFWSGRVLLETLELKLTEEKSGS